MEVSATSEHDLVLDAVATAAAEDDAPLSAWPEQLPGRWVTMARVAELLGRSGPKIAQTFRDLQAAGQVRAAHPWPAALKGYQLTSDREPGKRGEAPPQTDVRQWMLDSLRKWAEMHGGSPPSRADWSADRDPERRWPRANRVASFFQQEARDAGTRRFRQERCPDCACRTGRHYVNEEGDELCMGCFDCRGECPRGYSGEWEGLSGWQYALQLVGLEPRHGGDHHATAAQHLGRNRQMVTGGAADMHPQRFTR